MWGGRGGTWGDEGEQEEDEGENGNTGGNMERMTRSMGWTWEADKLWKKFPHIYFNLLICRHTWTSSILRSLIRVM